MQLKTGSGWRNFNVLGTKFVMDADDADTCFQIALSADLPSDKKVSSSDGLKPWRKYSRQ